MFFDFFSLGGHLPEGGIFCISKSMSDFFFACLQGFCPFDDAKVVQCSDGTMVFKQPASEYL